MKGPFLEPINERGMMMLVEEARRCGGEIKVYKKMIKATMPGDYPAYKIPRHGQC